MSDGFMDYIAGYVVKYDDLHFKYFVFENGIKVGTFYDKYSAIRFCIKQLSIILENEDI